MQEQNLNNSKNPILRSNSDSSEIQIEVSIINKEIKTLSNSIKQ